MSSEGTKEAAFGFLAATTGLGVITFALFPLALPILILTAASLIPLLALGLVVAIPVAVVAAVVLIVRAILRRARRGRDSVDRDEHGRRPVSALAGRG
jgi:membrane protein implicated in regulation of membrane protease activity